MHAPPTGNARWIEVGWWRRGETSDQGQKVWTEVALRRGWEVCPIYDWWNAKCMCAVLVCLLSRNNRAISRVSYRPHHTIFIRLNWELPFGGHAYGWSIKCCCLKEQIKRNSSHGPGSTVRCTPRSFSPTTLVRLIIHRSTVFIFSNNKSTLATEHHQYFFLTNKSTSSTNQQR